MTRNNDGAGRRERTARDTICGAFCGAQRVWPLTEVEIIDRFVGQSSSYVREQIEHHLGRSIDWEAEFETVYEEVYFAGLMPVAGIADALDAIRSEKCVASNGSHDSMQLTLGLTGILDRFQGRIFSANNVASAKPAPDLFLHDARTMGVPPHRCAVVEDSVAGVTAGVAAEMSVFGFSGSVISAELLTSAGAIAFPMMSELPDLLHKY